MDYQDLWPLIQQDIVGVLSADEFTGTRKVIAIEPGDVEDALNRKVQLAIGVGPDGKVGGGWLVLPIEKASDENASVPGGPLKLWITVQYVENVTLNRGPRGTTIPCRVWIAAAEKLLKLYTPVGFTQNLVPASPVVSEFTPDKDATLRVGQVEFTASEADYTPTIRLSRPQIVVTGSGYPFTASVTLPAGASRLFYTLDGSHPFEGNAQAVLYSEPVSITEPCLLRVRAFGVPPVKASDTNAKNFV